MAGVLVFGDTVGGKLAPASLEMAVAGAALAQALNEPLIAGGSSTSSPANRSTTPLTARMISSRATHTPRQ